MVSVKVIIKHVYLILRCIIFLEASSGFLVITEIPSLMFYYRFKNEHLNPT
jgi:hypothetical protein